MFNDRIDAARQLAEELKQYRGLNPPVLAIPRVAVPMAKVIADELGGSFDVVLVRKLRAPSRHHYCLRVVRVNKNSMPDKTPAPAFLLPHTTLNQSQVWSLRVLFD